MLTSTPAALTNIDLGTMTLPAPLFFVVVLELESMQTGVSDQIILRLADMHM